MPSLPTLLLTLTPLSLAFPTTTTAPSNRCSGPVDSLPWNLTTIVSFQAHPSANQQSFVGFTFCDPNPGLELQTTCSRELPAGSTASIFDPEIWYPCADVDVRYIFSLGMLQVERSYVDDCLGPFPYNGAVAFGQANTAMDNTTSAAGYTCTQEGLLMEITDTTS